MKDKKIIFSVEKSLVIDLDKHVKSLIEGNRSTVLRTALREYLYKKNKQKNA